MKPTLLTAAAFPALPLATTLALAVTTGAAAPTANRDLSACNAQAEPRTVNPATSPTILFIAVDDLNDWVLGARPYIQTPNLDRLRARGVTFMNAHCATAQCHPSRIAVLTGVRPSTSGIDRNIYAHKSASWRTGPDSGTGALKTAIVLSQHFRNHGYRAIGAGKIFHGLQWVDGSENEPEAWDDYYPSALDQIPCQPRPDDLIDDGDAGIIGQRPIGGGTDRRGQVFGAHPLKIPDTEMSDYKVVEWAAHQLRSPGQSETSPPSAPPPNREPQPHHLNLNLSPSSAAPCAAPAPLFLAVGLFRPHMPWEVPQKYFDLYPLDQIQRPPIKDDDLADTHGHDRVSWHKWVLANDAKHQLWNRFIQGYQASITFMDAQLGRLLDALDSTPLGKNTIIVLWSDHGMHFGEKQNWEKFTLWERSTRVPLIISAPGLARPGAQVTSPASLIDIYPTLCELAGLPAPPQCEGESLVPQLKNPAAPRAMPAITTQTMGRQSGHAVRDARWRYIRYTDGFEELYDMETDPNEFTNLATDPAHAPVKTRLRTWLEKIRAPLDGVYRRVDDGSIITPPKTGKTAKAKSD